MNPTVAIVGAGPAGLAAAAALTARGVRDIAVFDRDDTVGGLPRYCGHLGFGWEYSHRLEKGSAFIRRLIGETDLSRATLHPRTTVLEIAPGPVLRVVGPELGLREIRPKAVLVATGVRERPRAARLVPGTRPERGVLTTGALQQMETRGIPVPGPRAVVIGSEHVAFSVLLTARHCGLKVVAMVEPGSRVLSLPIARPIARTVFGVPILLNAEIEEIAGRAMVEAVVLRTPEGTRRILCDCVIFSGSFVPDAPLSEEGGLAIDPRTGGPVIDQYMRTSAPGVFAAGNLLRPVESSGIAALEGARAGACIAAFLAGHLDGVQAEAAFRLGNELRYLVPQRWAAETVDLYDARPLRPSLRVSTDTTGRIVLSADGAAVWQGTQRTLLRERRIAINLGALPHGHSAGLRVDLVA